MAKLVTITATAKLIGDIAEKVKKSLGVKLGKGLKGSGSLAGDSLDISLDEAYIKSLMPEAGETYTFQGDEYIDVKVS